MSAHREGRPHSRPRSVLIVNPNGNPEVTELARRAAERVLGPHTTVRAVNPEASPLSIETLAHRQRAEPLALDLLARHPNHDAYVMACFDDIAVGAARQFLGAPVVGAAEAAVAVARAFARRFTIVTTVETMVPGIHALIQGLGVADSCTVRAAGIGVARAATGEAETAARIDTAIEAARTYDGAGAIILGSAGLSGRAGALALRHSLPVVDSIEAAVAMAEIAARMSVMACPDDISS